MRLFECLYSAKLWNANWNRLARAMVALAVAGICGAGARSVADEIGFSATEPASGPSIKTDRGYMVPYTMTIPGTDVTFEMVPVPGGVSRVGSPESETGREADEGPAYEAELAPFWIGKYEVTWAEYRKFMAAYNQLKQEQSEGRRRVSDENRADAVTAPTPLYEPSFTFELGGTPRQPAVTMSQFAARQYTKWLSLLTTHTYRLPTEAEWEYACRAGSNTAYPFGDDATQLGDYAWFQENSEETYHPVGEKKPNAWGLFDMLGNVAELTLDQYQADGYAVHQGGRVNGEAAVNWPTKVFPHALRGGSWYDDPAKLRAAARFKTDKSWRERDPNFPLSPWWFTEEPARGSGFRLVRTLERPTGETLKRIWDADNEVLEQAVSDRLNEGRGVFGIVDPTLGAPASDPTE